MAMAYTKTDWKSRKGKGLNKFTKSGETAGTVYLDNTPDSVTEPGTSFTTEVMNNIENGIVDAHTQLGVKASSSVALVAGSGTAVDTPAQPATSTVWGLLQTIWNRIFALKNAKVDKITAIEAVDSPVAKKIAYNEQGQITEASNLTALDLGRGYGTSSTAAGTTTKVGTLAGFVRSVGAIVGIKFTYANTAASPTLNVNSTGAAAIRDFRTGAAPDTDVMGAMVHIFIFDGTYWVLLNPVIESESSGSATEVQTRIWEASNNLSYAACVSMGWKVGDYVKLQGDWTVGGDFIDLYPNTTYLMLIKEMSNGYVRFSHLSNDYVELSTTLYKHDISLTISNLAINVGQYANGIITATLINKKSYKYTTVASIVADLSLNGINCSGALFTSSITLSAFNLYASLGNLYIRSYSSTSTSLNPSLNSAITDINDIVLRIDI